MFSLNVNTATFFQFYERNVLTGREITLKDSKKGVLTVFCKNNISTFVLRLE